MQATRKARLHGLAHVLYGVAVATIGYFAGLRELQSGAPGTHSILYAYGILFFIGGHLVAEGTGEALGRTETDPHGRPPSVPVEELH
jgi:hypothetical protein